MKVKITNRKISVVMIIIIAWFILRLSFSFMDLQRQISILTNENAELQDGLNTLPFTQIGRDHLDGLNKTTGKILSIQLIEKAPIYYLNYTEIDIARAKETGEKLPLYFLGEPRLCWVIQFEQASRPGHSFRVWIDANTSNIIGMNECL